MTKKKLEKYRIRISFLCALNIIGAGLGCIFCVFYAFIYNEITYFFYIFLILVSFFFSSALLESVHFLLEERIYGEKNLEEDNKKPETKENFNKDK